jgi:predicted DNA-binding transcriptional regulator YafY
MEDGTLIWRAFIAEPREMLPWIRGWGADVEVIVPMELRKSIAQELRRAAAKMESKPAFTNYRFSIANSQCLSTWSF